MFLEPLGLFPLDESVYGVRDLAGQLCEWTSTPADAAGACRIVKGGSWGASALRNRCASRVEDQRNGVSGEHGFRIVAHRADGTVR